jgi:hypothetical protein
MSVTRLTPQFALASVDFALAHLKKKNLRGVEMIFIVLI